MCHRPGLVRAAAIAAVLGSAPLALADALGNSPDIVLERPYVGVGGAHAWANDREDADGGVGARMSMGWALGKRWSGELSASHFHFKTSEADGTDTHRSALGFDAVYVLNPADWTPLFIVGAGAVRDDSDERRTVRFTANGGLGLVSPPLNDYGVRLRFDARYVHDALAQRQRQVHAYLGVTVPLRKRRAQDFTPIEQREPVEELARPSEPPPAAPEARRVADVRDDCSSTPCGDATQTIVLRDVHFEFDSAVLTDAAISILEQTAGVVRDEDSEVEVAGHTDSIGSEAYNLALSWRRARSVVDFLASRGVERSRLHAVGYGESRPIADNSSAEGRARNRRVELRILVP
jgi:OOP family OmpA-OmpF porin